MLLQFAVENYKSIRERVVWSMLASEGVEHRPGQVVDVPGVGKVLRVAGLYGANASGKSNIVEAWHFLCGLASLGRKPRQATGRIPFKLDPRWRKQDTVLEVVSFLNDTVWTYGLRLDDTRVVKEWLHRGDEPAFERTTTRDGDSSTVWPETLRVAPKRAEFLHFVAEGTRPNQPLMAELRDRNATEFEPVYDFLSNASWAFSPIHETGGPTLDDTVELCVRYPDLREHLARFLRELETGIIDLALEASEPNTQQMIDEGKEISTAGYEQLLEIGVLFDLRFVHQGTDGRRVALEAEELSDGTRRLLGLAFGWYFIAGFTREPVILDELDRSFHPTLTRQLLLMALSTPGPSPSQLLFTTHDTNLLDAGLLGPDGIWFVEKDEHGASRLYSLAEFDPEHLAALTGQLEEGYLQGRFGAIPFIGDPAKLGWTDQGDEP